MILERRDVNISLIISSAPVNTSLLSPAADCRSSEADIRRKENVWISAFQQGVWPPGAPGWDLCFSAGSLAPRGTGLGSVLFSRESGPGGTGLGLVAYLVVSAGQERRRWCEWRPEVLLSILQVTRTAPTKGDQSLKVEKPWFWSGQ